MSDKYENLAAIAVTIVCAIVLGLLMGHALNTPVVQRAWPSGECVKVLGPEGHEYSCDNLPKKYDLVWVRP